MAEVRDVTYVLFQFTDSQKLGIGSLESIILPKTFQKKSVINKLKDLQVYISSKTKVGVS